MVMLVQVERNSFVWITLSIQLQKPEYRGKESTLEEKEKE